MNLLRKLFKPKKSRAEIASSSIKNYDALEDVARMAVAMLDTSDKYNAEVVKMAKAALKEIDS